VSFFVGRMLRRQLERLHARTVEMNGLTSSDGHHGVPTPWRESYSERRNLMIGSRMVNPQMLFTISLETKNQKNLQAS